MENLKLPLLSESEAQFRLMLEASPDGFMILRSLRGGTNAIADLIVQYANPAAANRFHCASQDLREQSLKQIFSLNENFEVFSRAIAVAESGVSDTFEIYCNGQQIKGWFRFVVVKLDDGIGLSFNEINKRDWDDSDRQRVEQRRDTQYAVSKVLAEATTVEDATPAILQALCENLGWQAGVIWEIDPSHSVLQCVNWWHNANADVKAFLETSEQITFAQGIGLPGRVWERCETTWITELHKDHNFPRAALASQVQLRSAFGFPICVEDKVLGVIECFSSRLHEPDKDLLNLMAAIGSQIGQFMERRRAEAALRDSQELFQRFMNCSPIAAFIKDASGRHLYVNVLAEQIIQRSHDDIIGKTNFDLFPPDVAQVIQANDMAALNSEQGTRTIETLQLKDGLHDYMSFKFPFRNAVGETLLAGVSVDITEQQVALRDRLQAEQELRQRELELRLITNAVPVLISFVDTEQRYRFNNQKYEEWFGRPDNEVCGKYLWEVLGEVAYETIRPYVEQVLAGHEVTFETKVPYKEGGVRYVQATYVPRLNPQGTVEGFVALVNDITQRKHAEETRRQSEERLSIAQKAANAGVWDWQIGTNQVTWSEEYYRLYGLDPEVTQPSYENWLQSIVEQDRDRVNRAAHDALEHQIDLNVEFRIHHPTLGERWLTAIGQTFYDGNQHPQRMTGIALDITENKRIENALRESEARFQAIVRNIPGMIYRYAPQADGSDAFTYVSSGSRDLLELEPEAILQDANLVWAAVHSDDFPSLQSSIAIAVANLQSWEWEGRIITPSGQIKWIQGTSRPASTEFGTVWDGLLIDISERKQAEQALRESEERLRLALAAASQGLYDLNVQTGEAIVSPEYAQMLGYQPEDLQETNAKWRERLHPDDVAIVYQTYQDYIAGKLDTYRVEFRQQTQSGEWKWILSIGQIVSWDAEGNPLRMLGTHTDITERKQAEAALCQSEERYRYLAESIPQLVWTSNAEGVLIDINQRWETFTGLTLSQVRRDGWQAVVHPDDIPVLQQNWVTAQQNGTYYQAEGRMRRTDGVYRWHLHQAVPLRNDQGQIIKWFGTATDIEDQKQLEYQRTQLLQQEQAAREQAEAANRIKDEFLAVLSHELRSPLNPILGWAKLLRSRKLDANTVDRALETIERNATLQTQLIGDLLDVSRILQGKLSLNIAPVELATTIAAAIETMQLAAEAKAIEVSFEVKENENGKVDAYDHQAASTPDNALLPHSSPESPTDASIHVMGDSARLQQVIWNLLSNAVKFTPEGGRVQIWLEQVEGGSVAQLMEQSFEGVMNAEVVGWQYAGAEQNSANHQNPSPSVHFPAPSYAQITVSDNGQGISPQFLPYVFDYFRQADGATTRKFGGLGLGLAIVRHLVELHGGTVAAFSLGEGQGATFTIRLPLMKVSGDNKQLPLADLQSDSKALPLQGLRILLVDDDPDTRDYLAFVIEQAGATVTIATSAQETLQKLGQASPHILLSDIGMPDTDGYGLIRQVRQLPPEQGGATPAIALTAYAGDFNQQQAIAAGFQMHLAKPAEPADIVKAISTLTSQSLYPS